MARTMASITLVSCHVLFLLAQVMALGNDIDDANKRVVMVGTSLQLPCAPPGGEEILDYFTWSKNGVLLPDRSSTAFESRFLIQGNFSLLIASVAEDDEGIYSCSIQSDPPRTTNYSVHVEVPASIDGHESEPSQHQLQEGTDLDLVCLAKGRPLPTVTWKYQGRVLSAEESIVDVNQKVSSVHRIEKARRTDAGSYVCEADNGVDLPSVATFNVEISYAPEIVVEQNWVHTGLGSLTELACSVYSQPPAQVTWFRSGEGVERHLEPVASSNRIGTLVMSNGLKHVLRFKSVRDVDLGVYTCQAENSLGRAEAAIEMSGKAVAAVLWVSPPREKIEADQVNGSKTKRIGYRLTWDVVSISPIYEYRLWLKPRGQPETNWINLIIPSNATSSSSSLHSQGYELSDLTPGVVYQISIQSRNRFGWSAESNTVYLSGGEDPELDYDTTEDKLAASPTAADSQPTKQVTSEPATSPSPVASSSETVQLSIEVSGSVTPPVDNEATEDNETTLPALVIDPVSVQHHGTHLEVQTTTLDTPTQAASQSTDSAEKCPTGDPNCSVEDQDPSAVSPKDPDHFPSSIVAPGNSVSRPMARYLSVVLCLVVVVQHFSCAIIN